MSTPMLSQVIADTIGAPAGHAGAAPYVLAFLSSTAVEVIAVAALLSMLAFGIARSVRGSTSLEDHRPWGGLDALKLYKIVIPLVCLTMTAWIWISTQGG